MAAHLYMQRVNSYLFFQTDVNPLNAACENGNNEIVQILLSKGANINQADNVSK